MALAPAAPLVGAAGLVVPAARSGAVHGPVAVVSMPRAVPLILIAVPAIALAPGIAVGRPVPANVLAPRVTVGRAVTLVSPVLPVGPRVWGP